MRFYCSPKAGLLACSKKMGAPLRNAKLGNLPDHESQSVTRLVRELLEKCADFIHVKKTFCAQVARNSDRAFIQ